MQLVPTEYAHIPVREPLGRVDVTIALSLAALAAAFILPGLGTESLTNWDEAIYGVVVRELLEHPGVTLHYGGEPLFAKPPLLFWLMAASSAVLGLTEFALRLPSALFGLLTVILAYLAGRELAGRASGILAALLLLGVPHFVAWSRLAMLDVPLVAFGLLSVVLILYGERRPGLTIAAGAAFGLAILTKWVAAFLFVPGLVALVVARRGVRALVSREMLAAAGAALLIALPWHLHQAIVYGRDFVESYVLLHVVKRIKQPFAPLHVGKGTEQSLALQHTGGPSYYFTLYKHDAGLLAPVHAIGLALAIAITVRRRDWPSGAVVLLAAAPFMSVSLMATKIGWYLIPVYPGAALATALATTRLLRSRTARAAACAVALPLAVSGALDGRGAFVEEYNVLDFSPEVRALRGAPPFTSPVPLLYVHVVSEPAPHFYLAERIEALDGPALERLVASEAPFLCLTFERDAEKLLQTNPRAGLRITARTTTLAVIERPQGGAGRLL